MLPTLAPGQFLATRPVRGHIESGDIVVFAAANGRLYVKRVAGMPGDVVTLEAGRLSVNEQPLGISSSTTSAHTARWQVTDGHCFVVGDNLQESDDSRVWVYPFVALARIRGVGLWTWPWRWLAAKSYP